MLTHIQANQDHKSIQIVQYSIQEIINSCIRIQTGKDSITIGASTDFKISRITHLHEIKKT